ncbi:hypothetical protein PISMIDRAFT_13606 [Pisolithus microcarpus 441]|uniref:Uncharacterized protein n=1 Tax=Pisolithus microcarpus 441 TaxID=765257 RepID=A0A0C9Z011_9AGAM|nr:hypothetical protein PISMIDRAFT_13606 [Pisolithus microcarpus 441]
MPWATTLQLCSLAGNLVYRIHYIGRTQSGNDSVFKASPGKGVLRQFEQSERYSDGQG